MAQFFHSKIWAATRRHCSFVFPAFLCCLFFPIKQISVRKCGSSPHCANSWCLSEADSHPFWPSFCNQAFMALPAKSDKQFTEITARNPPATQYVVPMFNTVASSIHLFTPRRGFHRLDRVLCWKVRTNCKVKGHTHPGMAQYWSSRGFLLPRASS